MDKSTRIVIIIGIVIILSTVLLTFMFTQEVKPSDQEQEKPLGQEQQQGSQGEQQLANPASVYCEEQGGVLEIRSTPEGEAGYCIFADGTECEEWAYYQGECPEKDVNDAIPQENGTISGKIAVGANRTSIGNVAKTRLLQLTPWTDRAVSMNLPIGWKVYTGGECSTKSILARDPHSELKQIFYFSEAGPVYTSQGMKENDQAYMAMGGFPVLWADSPVVSPLTSENYLKNFGELASGNLFQQAFPQVPVITDVRVITREEQEKPYFATDAQLIRAEFTQNGRQGEGYFYVMTADMGIGLGYGMMVIGITAPKGLLDLLTPSLKESLSSFSVNQDYVSACIDAGNKAAAGALKAGQILSETSDIIMDVWENKLEAEDRMSQKWSDAMLGHSRLYNPDTDEVYEVTPEFFDYYTTHSDKFEMNNLQELPDDKWAYAPLNGGAHIS